MEAKTRTVAKINDVRIFLIEEGEKFVPIKPICELLGIDIEGQRKKIKSDDILQTAVTIVKTAAADGKSRRMTCLPYMYIFGWLFTINPKNVKPEAKKAVSRYKLECYNALYEHSFHQSAHFEKKQAELERKIKALEEEIDRELYEA